MSYLYYKSHPNFEIVVPYVKLVFEQSRYPTYYGRNYDHDPSLCFSRDHNCKVSHNVMQTEIYNKK